MKTTSRSSPKAFAPLRSSRCSEQLRPDARETLDRLTAAGVTLKLISGDNPQTVAALTRQMGLVIESAPVSGLDLVDMDDAGLSEAVGKATIFGRVPPSLKARLVQALRSRGYWVAMVGDGVNDVLSLKQAHLGISMQSGSQATRAVADMVLLEDSFSASAGGRGGGPAHHQRHAGQPASLPGARDVHVAGHPRRRSAGAGDAGLAAAQHRARHWSRSAFPALFLAFWARPARPGLDSLRRILRLIIPPAVVLAVIGVPLYWFYFADG